MIEPADNSCKNVTEQLRSHPLFATLSPEALEKAVAAAKAITFEKGQACIRQGDANEIFGVLLSGRLAAVRDLDTSHAEEVGTVNPGECFGEMSMLTGNSSNISIVSLEESEIVIFLQEEIGPILAVNREAVQFLTRLISTRLAPAQQPSAPAQPTVAKFSLSASRSMRVLSVSCRRCDMRYSFFDTSSDNVRASGSITGLGGDNAVHSHRSSNKTRQGSLSANTHEAALQAAMNALVADGVLNDPADLSAIGHRVCHGGLVYDGPAVVTEKVLEDIRNVSNLAPVENPYNIAGIEICQRLAPNVPQVAVFDTSYYLRMPRSAYCYPLPKELANDPMLRRFGSHGISHEGAAHAASAFLGKNFNALKIISCHLGSGASMTAIDHGRPVDCSMGLTPMSGLIMATRPGDLDPGLLLHLIRDRGMDPKELTHQLFTKSGLEGLSGISGNVLAVMQAADGGDSQALLALEAYCRSAKKYLSSYVGVLGGVDTIVFTGGVGQHTPGLRARICQGLEWMGVHLDEARNRGAHVEAGEVAEISHEKSCARVVVVGGNENHTIAHHAVRAVSQLRVTDVMRDKNTTIPLGISAHHVHLTQEHVEILFGPGHTLTWFADLTQPGQFACEEKVSLIGPKGRIDRVRVLGPVRPETQVEIARTEEFKLGVDAPVRMSGDLDGTPGTTLEGPAGQVHLEKGVICARRHIHMSPQEAIELAVRDRDVVRINIPGERSLIFGDVVVRVHPEFRLDMHIDTDEANAAEMDADSIGYLDSIQERASV